MRKSKWLKILLIIIVVILVGGAIYLVSDQRAIGKEIDSYKNVAIYYNGIIYTNAYGKNYSEDGYYYGQKWQCVEYIKRFYYQAKKHKMPDVYGNGSSVKPEVDDLIVFTDTSFGYVAIVIEVSSSYVEVIQQNVYGKTRDRYELIVKDGQYYVETKRKPAGWLRILI